MSKTGNDENGSPIFGYRIDTLCSVIKLNAISKPTNPKGSRSGSVGNAFEMTSDATLLFTPLTKIKIADLIYVGGVKMSIISISQQINHLNGLIDHYQVELNVYGA